MRSEIPVVCDMIAIVQPKQISENLIYWPLTKSALLFKDSSCGLLPLSCGSWLYAKALADLCGDDE